MAQEITVAREGNVNPRNAVRGGGDKISNPSARLSMSDLNFRKSKDDESNSDLDRDDLLRWDIPNVAYLQDGQVTSTYATITQFLDSPRGSVGGYEAFFDKPFAIGESRTLDGAKKLILDRINKLRGNVKRK